MSWRINLGIVRKPEVQYITFLYIAQEKCSSMFSFMLADHTLSNNLLLCTQWDISLLHLRGIELSLKRMNFLPITRPEAKAEPK